MSSPQQRAATASTLAIAQAWYQRQALLARKTAQAVQGWWATLDQANLDASFAKISPRLVGAIGAGQMLASTGADNYVAQTTAAQGLATAAAGRVDPRAFAGLVYPFATDADQSPEWTMQELVRQPLITAKVAIAKGQPVDTAMMQGRVQLVRLATTQVQDAGRGAVSVGMVQRPEVEHYIRVLTPPSCSRCVVLAGMISTWDTAFLRHPFCDCINVPVGDIDRAKDFHINPHSYFDSLSKTAQDDVFTVAGAQAIRDGADIYQVVNSRRGMQTTVIGGQKISTTTEGTTKRGLARQRLGSARIPRITPEQIYKDAGGNRDTAIALLQRFGYIL